MMSVSLQLVDEHRTHLAHHDQRDAPTHSPALSSSPIPPSPSSAISASSGPSTATDSHSPFSLPAVAPVASPLSTDAADDASSAASAAARIKSLISGVSTSLIASAVREKAYTDLQRLEEIFASPAEQAHLTKQQKWKLALRQQRLKLYLQQTNMEREQAEDGVALEGEQTEVAEVAAAEQSAAADGAHSLTIFTTPLLPAAVAQSLTAELSSFSLYTPDSLNASHFTFAAAPPLGLRTPSAPAEAQYTLAVDDERLQTESDDSSMIDEQHATQHGAASPRQPHTPTSASTSSLPPRRLPPHQRRTASRLRAPSPLAPPLPVQVSRSGRTIKRRFDVSSIGGRKSRRVATSAAEEVEAVPEEPQARAWERSYEEEEEESEEEQSEDEHPSGAQHVDYGVAYRQH